jgi:hypothetical protein
MTGTSNKSVGAKPRRGSEIADRSWRVQRSPCPDTSAVVTPGLHDPTKLREVEMRTRPISAQRLTVGPQRYERFHGFDVVVASASVAGGKSRSGELYRAALTLTLRLQLHRNACHRVKCPVAGSGRHPRLSTWYAAKVVDSGPSPAMTGGGRVDESAFPLVGITGRALIALCMAELLRMAQLLRAGPRYGTGCRCRTGY